MRTFLIITGMLLATVAESAAQETETEEVIARELDLNPPRDEPLATQVFDPTAPLLQVALSYEWLPEFHDIEGNADIFRVQGTVPFNVFGWDNVFHVEVPYEFDHPARESGFAPTLVRDLVLWQRSWARLAFGATATIDPGGQDTGEGDDDPSFGAGPTIGLVTDRGPWRFGFLNQNVFGDESVSMIQPVVGYTFNERLSVATGDWQMVYNWDEVEITQFPIGGQVNYIYPVMGQPVRLWGQALYNLSGSAGEYSWALTFGAGVLVGSAS